MGLPPLEASSLTNCHSLAQELHGQQLQHPRHQKQQQLDDHHHQQQQQPTVAVPCSAATTSAAAAAAAAAASVTDVRLKGADLASAAASAVRARHPPAVAARAEAQVPDSNSAGIACTTAGPAASCPPLPSPPPPPVSLPAPMSGIAPSDTLHEAAHMPSAVTRATDSSSGSHDSSRRGSGSSSAQDGAYATGESARTTCIRRDGSDNVATSNGSASDPTARCSPETLLPGTSAPERAPEASLGAASGVVSGALASDAGDPGEEEEMARDSRQVHEASWMPQFLRDRERGDCTIISFSHFLPR